jgi:hypothetical protein
MERGIDNVFLVASFKAKQIRVSSKQMVSTCNPPTHMARRKCDPALKPLLFEVKADSTVPAKLVARDRPLAPCSAHHGTAQSGRGLRRRPHGWLKSTWLQSLVPATPGHPWPVARQTAPESDARLAAVGMQASTPDSRARATSARDPTGVLQKNFPKTRLQIHPKPEYTPQHY